MKYTAEILALCVFLGCTAALVVVMSGGGHAWEGSDAQAEAAVQEISGGYEPWARPLWSPPSGEIETLLFTLPAAGGALVIGFFFGYYAREKRHP